MIVVDDSVTQYHHVPAEDEEPIGLLARTKTFRSLQRERFFVVDSDGTMREGHVESDAFPPIFERLLRETRARLLDSRWLP